MRLWSLHPKYLDSQGLVALWREGLLAQAVLRGETKGYRHHPQLERFREQAKPRAAIAAYLAEVEAEAVRRGYQFDRRKVGRGRTKARIAVTRGQLKFEWSHLRRKLAARSPEVFKKWNSERGLPEAHPVFRVVAGAVESWERP
ncbi:MAG: pyrimidine dimer DNA glycosylase/endonuclease V [Opitutales bacterium]|jgi:hypothetical protein